MTYSQRRPWGYVFLGFLLACLPAIGMAQGYGASRVQIQVLDQESGKAVSNASVCLGTTARLDQFGASRTDRDGMVKFNELLPNSLIATVSKQGFKGHRHLLEDVSESRTFVLKIVPGGGGLQCKAQAAAPAGAEAVGLMITSLNVGADTAAAGAGRVLVSVNVAGSANQVRISERGDFSGSDWQKLVSPVAYQLSGGRGLKNLYVQVRRYAQVEGANIEVTSPVRRVQYRY